MNKLLIAAVSFLVAQGLHAAAAAPALGLPPVPIPADNPQSTAKITLGKQLYNDKRFSSTGQVSCASCHSPNKAFTDHIPIAEGIHKRKGTRNSPTVINAAYFHRMFWDGREPSMEQQAKDPMVNPVEMGLKDHQPVLRIVRSDPRYVAQFKKVFGTTPETTSMNEVLKAIASFERTVVSGNSPFDHYFFGGNKKAISPAAIRGLALFQDKARCADCHAMNTTDGLFTDNRFHNLGIGSNELGAKRLHALAAKFIREKQKDPEHIDKVVLTEKGMSELGRFVITSQTNDIGAFKTPILRNVAVTPPYMHNGSLKTLMDVVDFYNNGGRIKKTDKANIFQSGGIRPLNLTASEKRDLVAFLETLTSPEFARDGIKGRNQFHATRR